MRKRRLPLKHSEQKSKATISLAIIGRPQTGRSEVFDPRNPPFVRPSVIARFRLKGDLLRFADGAHERTFASLIG
jgi:hypothetical protein